MTHSFIIPVLSYYAHPILGSGHWKCPQELEPGCSLLAAVASPNSSISLLSAHVFADEFELHEDTMQGKTEIRPVSRSVKLLKTGKSEAECGTCGTASRVSFPSGLFWPVEVNKGVRSRRAWPWGMSPACAAASASSPIRSSLCVGHRDTLSLRVCGTGRWGWYSVECPLRWSLPQTSWIRPESQSQDVSIYFQVCCECFLTISWKLEGIRVSLLDNLFDKCESVA